jgi:outer membrane immunogenic protein
MGAVMMRSVFGVVGFSLMLIGAPLSVAAAADMPLKAPPMAPAMSWTGCYIGANVGAGWQYNRPFDPTTPTLSVGSDVGSGFVGGGQAGCDYQFSGRWVVGLQGMFDGAAIKGSYNVPLAYAGDTGETMSFQSNWFATLTGRLGYVLQPQTLIYVKGGAAWTRINYGDIDLTGIAFPPFIGQASATPIGWTVGGGVEYAIARNVSAFLEYNYADFGSQNVNFNYNCGAACGFPNPYLYQETHRLQTVLIGLNYRFGGLGR